MSAYLHGMSHTLPVGFVDTTPEVPVEVDTIIAETHERIARFDPELIPHYNGFFYDVMPAFALA
jgi:2,3-dihydroxyphenylpropionate 1,2-dioxygenase